MSTKTTNKVIHNVSIKMDIFDNEWKPLVKLFNRACCNDEIMSHFSEEECERLSTFIDCFKELALNHSE